MPDYAAGSGAQKAVVDGKMPGNAANHGAFDAAFCVRWNCRDRNDQCQRRAAKYCFHPVPGSACSAANPHCPASCRYRKLATEANTKTASSYVGAGRGGRQDWQAES